MYIQKTFANVVFLFVLLSVCFDTSSPQDAWKTVSKSDAKNVFQKIADELNMKDENSKAKRWDLVSVKSAKQKVDQENYYHLKFKWGETRCLKAGRLSRIRGITCPMLDKGKSEICTVEAVISSKLALIKNYDCKIPSVKETVDDAINKSEVLTKNNAGKGSKLDPKGHGKKAKRPPRDPEGKKGKGPLVNKSTSEKSETENPGGKESSGNEPKPNEVGPSGQDPNSQVMTLPPEATKERPQEFDQSNARYGDYYDEYTQQESNDIDSFLEGLGFSYFG